MTDSRDPDAQRNRIIRERNMLLGLLLGGFAILVFAISLVKLTQ